MSELDLRVEPYDGLSATRLVELVQQEYVVRYGGVDATVVDPADFLEPNGSFLVGYLDGDAVACGGWRRLREFPGVGELKRMYVVPGQRGRGFARLVLAALEDSMRAAGCLRAWLETGVHQPEALALYTSAGYLPIDGYGHYRDAPLARPMGRDLT